MKVLTSGEQLEGKKIVYCEIANTADVDTSMIITADKGVFMFSLGYDGYTWHTYKENQVESKILISKTIKKILLEHGVITEKEIKEMQEDVNKKNRERDKKIEEARYQEYLELKEKYEGK